MSGRPILNQALRQALRQPFSSRQETRCLQTLPRNPPTRHLLRRQPQPHPSLQLRRTFAKDSTRTFAGNARILFRNHPISMSLAFVCIALASASLIYVNYYYQTYIIGAYHNFPEEVAKKLRRAIYFSTTDLNPQEAVKYYRQAAQVAEELGMDPFSDEVMGIKIHVAGLMERIQQFGKAVEVLERVRGDNLKWLELYSERKEEFDRDPDMRKKRTRILAKTVGISVKLGEHYANPAVWDRDMALERLVWAVETVEKEKRRRQEVGATQESDGQWMTDDEQGAALEALAHGYEEKGMHYLATPLFLQALSLKEATDCHSVVLMNNVASSLAQQSPQAARRAHAVAESKDIKSPDAPTGPVATRETLIENAKLWAQKALDVAANIEPPVRDEECDVGCAVAMHNLGEFAEMLKDSETAKKKYVEAVSLSRAIGFEEGVENSSARLRELGVRG